MQRNNLVKQSFKKIIKYGCRELLCNLNYSKPSVYHENTTLLLTPTNSLLVWS